MVPKLPFEEWLAAQRELKCIWRRSRMIESPDLEMKLRTAWRVLSIDRLPLMAACELKAAVKVVEKYPHLKDQLLRVAGDIADYPLAEPSPPVRCRTEQDCLSADTPARF